MKLKLLSTGIAALALLPIATTAVTETASAASISEPQSEQNISVRNNHGIFDASGYVHVYPHFATKYFLNDNGDFSIWNQSTFDGNSWFAISQIAVTKDGTYFHQTGSRYWINGNECDYSSSIY